MAGSSWLLLVALLQSSIDRTPADSSACTFDREVAVELTGADPPLEGHGACKRVEYTSDFSGTLHVWTESAPELDLFLRVEDADRDLVAEDDDSGGKPTPYVMLAIAAGKKLVVTVTGKSDGTFGSLTLHFAAAPETEETRSMATKGAEELAEIKKLRVEKQIDRARERMKVLIDALTSVQGGRVSEAVSNAAYQCGYEAMALSVLSDSVRAWRFSLEHRSRVLPDNHADLQAARLNVGSAIYSLGDYAGARELSEKLLEVRSRTLAEDHPDLQRARLGLAAAIKAQGDLAGARALEEKVLEVFSRTRRDDDPDLQLARENLSATLKALGEHEQAGLLDEKVFEVRSRTLADDDRDLQDARTHLAATRSAQGDLVGARELFAKVVTVFEHTLPSDHPELQNARLNLAVTVKSLGDLDLARALEEKVLELRSRALPDDHRDLQRARLNLARTLEMQGNPAGALALQERVLAALERSAPNDQALLSRARADLAISLRDLGDHARARVLQEQVLEARSRTRADDHPDLQAARGNLAATLHELGEFASARELQEKMLDAYSRTLPDDHPDVQRARQNLAMALVELGEVGVACDLLEQVLDVRSRTRSAEHLELQQARTNLATVLMLRGDPARARALIETALGVLVRTLPVDHHERLQAEHQLVRACAELGDVAAARPHVFELLRGARHAVGSMLGQVSPREAAVRVSAVRAHLDLAASVAGGSGPSGRDGALDEEVWSLIELCRAADLVAARVVDGARTDPALQALRRDTADKSAEVARLAQGAIDRDALAAAITRRDSAQRALARELASDEFTAATIEPTLASVASRIAKDQTLVAYYRYARSTGRTTAASEVASLLACVIRPDASLTRVELGAVDSIERAAQAYRFALGAGGGRGVTADATSTGNDEGVRASGRELARLVFDPLRPHLGDAQRLTVALDDVLHTVPLDALPDGDGLLGDRFTFDVCITLRDLFWRNETSRASIHFVGLGDAAFDPAVAKREPSATDGPAGSEPIAISSVLRGGAWEQGFTGLPGTAAEVAGLADLHRSTFGENNRREVLRGHLASRASLLELAPKARFLHVATHGWFAPESVHSWIDAQPLDARSGLGVRMSAQDQVIGASPMVLCGLALAGANSPANELGVVPGLVTAEEIAAWDLSSCELVVLSACDTNVGVRRAGQGVASLQKALHMAGAQSVITSLWKVPDEATKDMMLDFYRRLWVDKKPKHQALWEAKKMLREAKDEHGASRYTTRDWAAWVLTGNPN